MLRNLVAMGLSAIFLGLAGAQEEGKGRFALQVYRVLRGKAWVLMAEGGQKKRLKEGDEVAPGGTLRADPKSVVVLTWLPYRARVKLGPSAEVQLAPDRFLRLVRGRIWLGTPPQPFGHRRYPLPIHAAHVRLASTPDAIFSVAILPGRIVLVSVDVGAVAGLAEVEAPVKGKEGAPETQPERVIVSFMVMKGMMIRVFPDGSIDGPKPMTEAEKFLWDAGGPAPGL